MNDHHSDPAAAKPEDPASRPASTPEADTPSAAPANSDDAGTAASAGADTSMPRWPQSADEAPAAAASSSADVSAADPQPPTAVAATGAEPGRNAEPAADAQPGHPAAAGGAAEPPVTTPATGAATGNPATPATPAPGAGAPTAVNAAAPATAATTSAAEPNRPAEPATAVEPSSGQTTPAEPTTQGARLGPLPPNGPAPGSRPPLPPNAGPGYPASPGYPTTGFPAGPPPGTPGGPPHSGPPTGPIPMVGPGGHPMGAAPAKPRSKAPLLLAAALVVALGAGAVGGVTGYALAGGGDTSASSPSELVADGKTISDIAKKVQPSVVSIATEKAGGSGVVYDDSGHIITNNHVAETAQGGKLEVTFADGSSSQASVVGTDPAGDLAVIKVEDTANLTPIKMGDSDKLDVGDTVLAIGSPLGLDGSVTSGIVSATNRTVQAGGGEQGGSQTTLSGLVQTDAAINPGNSGGALVNGKGELIGINTVIATTGSSEGSVGLGFAIPSNTVASTIDQLIKGGKAEHGYLGVGVVDNVSGSEGAVITEVADGSPAADAGLKRGDVITAIDGQSVAGASDVGSIVMGAKPGTKVTIEYNRNGDGKTANAELGSTSSAD